ncbi:MAG: hypothetical protein GX604_05250 [Actinobacteria bacterium]|nr:hypothetical protein [Actinomycetota bacterium]
MHPQAFLKTFWRLELRPQVFVAMSFAPQYQGRFDNVIAPAVRGITVGDQPLSAFRVDLSKSGDSILTDIVDGIAHSQIVLADVSSVGKDSVTGVAYRNGNVMYEVGIALACRHSSEVLLVRDDEDRFLFDVSSIPHMKIDFTNPASAVPALQEALLARLRERQLVQDARVELALAGISNDEVVMLRQIAEWAPGTVFGRISKGTVDFFGMASIPRLLDKQLIRAVGQFEDGQPAYEPTPLGRVVAVMVKDGLRKFTDTSRAKNEEADASATEPA